VGVLLPALVLVAASVVPPGAQVKAANQTVVSLTFDDGLSNQTLAAQSMQNYGMRGTFYVVSGRVGNSGVLSISQMQSMQAAGHEIAGHTKTHVNLPSLSYSQQQAEICGDKAALENMGLRIDNFAYPFGAYNSSSIEIARNCGYDTARTVGGLSCSGCAPATTIPPARPYELPTPDSVKSTTTLAQMQAMVMRAENAGGGWVPIVFHHICDACNTYSVSQATLNSFLSWLSARQASGTVVRTVAQVMGSAPSPTPTATPVPTSTPTATPVPTPTPTSTPTPGTNLVLNPSLEADANADKVPDCWQLGGYGTNTYSWLRSADAHSGSFAERLQITSLASGDRKLVTSQRDLACAPTPTIGKTYTLSAWYKSDQPVLLTAYYRNSAGAWVWWAQSPSLAASGGYVKANWTTPAVPAGATKLSVGLTLARVGTYTVDDFSLVQN
jgi:peptidoglycan/xylan/chitin deacetylase (PgdA/CDA1 family)